MADKDLQEKVHQLQMIEQSVSHLGSQRQSHQAQLMEIESAMRELETAPEAYRIVGNIMVRKDKAALKKELHEKKETADLRIQTLDRQEARFKEKAQKLQLEVLDSIKENEKNKTKGEKKA
ncbi:prefoldin subunit beta [Candidatus Woesearchaeota archaeon]|nr:prefoldin subunit beta [Candidatus Woesearchaeota archaeon]